MGSLDLSVLEALPSDVLFHILARVSDASGLRALFQCSRTFCIMRYNLHLRKVWLKCRTNIEAVTLLQKAVASNNTDQVLLLLCSDTRDIFTTSQLASAMLSAMRLRHTVMYQFIPFCQMTIPPSDEDELMRIIREHDVVHGFQLCHIKLHGDEESTDTLSLTTINAVTSDGEGSSGTFTYFECRSATTPRHQITNNGITVVLGGPPSAYVKRAIVKKIVILNRKLIIKCAVG